MQKLRIAERALPKGKAIPEACKQLAISEGTRKNHTPQDFRAKYQAARSLETTNEILVENEPIVSRHLHLDRNGDGSASSPR